MDTLTKKAIKQSIVHWQENLMILQLNYLSKEELQEDIRIMGGDCPLCKLFDVCTDCPICKSSGCFHCYCTPWEEVRGLLQYSFAAYSTKTYYEKLFKAISNEINFLEGLL